MLDESAKYFEELAKQLGLTIKIPRPGSKLKRTSALTNGLVGASFIASGIICKKTALMLIGTLGIAGALLLLLDE